MLLSRDGCTQSLPGLPGHAILARGAQPEETRRGLPGQFAYVVMSSLQIITQMQAKAQTIISAQRSRGLDTQSSFLRRVGGILPLVGPLVFGSLVEVEERAIAIEARGEDVVTTREPGGTAIGDHAAERRQRGRRGETRPLVGARVPAEADDQGHRPHLHRPRVQLARG